VAENRTTNIFLTAAFAAAICSVALIQTAVEISRAERPQFAELFLQTPAENNLRAFEKDLEDNCWLAHKVRPLVRYARFLALKDTGDKALLGRNGWFFYKPAAQYLIERWPADSGAAAKDVLSAIISFHKQLDERGIRLILMPVPNKVSIYPEMLSARAANAAPPVNRKTLEIISALKNSGIEVVDLFEVFSDARTRLPSDDVRYYLAQDSHWSPEAVRLAAQAAAKKILDLGWVKKGTVQYGIRPLKVTRYGDILRMMQAPRLERLFNPEQLTCNQVIEAGSGWPYQDDPSSAVLVLGDSFLRIYQKDEPGSAGFIAHLAGELGFGLTSIVNDGGASTLVRQELTRRPALLANKKIVIWEFVERDIRFGTEGWQIIPLP